LRVAVVEVEIVTVRLGHWKPLKPPADPEIGEIAGDGW
jgi:hypothetical protein